MHCKDAKASRSLVKKTFYHGTGKIDAAISIFKKGIVPSVTTPDMIKKSREWCNTVPFEHMVYLTSSLPYAIIYAIEGVYFGVSVALDEEEKFKKDGKYGFIFFVDGSQLSNIQPDEDKVGDIIEDLLMVKRKQKPWGDYDLSKVPWLLDFTRDILGEDRWNDLVKDIDEPVKICTGKEVLRAMDDDQKILILEAGVESIANEGTVIPSSCFVFDKHDRVKMKRDGSNFFAYAKKSRVEDVLKLRK